MNLIEKMMEDCVILDKTTSRDSAGGKVITYVEGATIKAVVAIDDSLKTIIAGADSTTDSYTITTTKDDALGAQDVIKRVSDGLILKVTNDTIDFPTVSSNMMNKYTKVKAEKWSLPT